MTYIPHRSRLLSMLRRMVTVGAILFVLVAAVCPPVLAHGGDGPDSKGDVADILLGVRGELDLTRQAMAKETAAGFYERITSKHVEGCPPAIANAKFAAILVPLWNMRTDRAGLTQRIGLAAVLEKTSPIQSYLPSMAREEPGLYVLAALLYDNCDAYAALFGLPETDPMALFAKGVSKFYSTYAMMIPALKGGADLISLKEDIERPLLEAFFLCAGFSDWNALAGQFYQLTIEQRISLLEKCVEAIRARPWRDQIIAAWSAMWLVNAMDRRNNFDLGDILFTYAEQPLAELTYPLRSESETQGLFLGKGV